MLLRNCSYNILVKNVAAFCPCLKSLFETTMKRFGIALRKEISKKQSIDSALWFALMKSVLIKHSKLRKEKCQIYGSSIIGAPGSGMELNPVFKKIKRLRE